MDPITIESPLQVGDTVYGFEHGRVFCRSHVQRVTRKHAYTVNNYMADRNTGKIVGSPRMSLVRETPEVKQQWLQARVLRTLDKIIWSKLPSEKLLQVASYLQDQGILKITL